MTLDRSELQPLVKTRRVPYLEWPLPCARDDEIERLVARLSSDQSTYDELGPDDAGVLGIFAERMASLARREGSPERLRAGLKAIAIALPRVRDARDELHVLALLWRSAVVLDLDPRTEFLSAAQFEMPTSILSAVANREQGAQPVEVMGYIEVDDPSGLWYERGR